MKKLLAAHWLFASLVTALSTSLVVGVLGVTRITAAGRATPPAPTFLSWGSASGVIPGRFLVTFATGESVDGRLIDDGGTLFVNPDAGGVDVAGVDEIRTAVDGGYLLADEDRALASLVSNAAVTSVKPVGFDMYLVDTTLDVATLADLPGVAEVVPDFSVDGASSDEFYPEQWGIDNVGDVAEIESVAGADVEGPLAWHRARGDGVVVAVVDSGVDVDHPDLAAAIWHNPGETCGNGVDDDHNGYVDDCTGWNFADQDPSVVDNIGHGTHVAGIIAATADNRIGVAGLAYQAQIMPLKIGDSDPTLSAAVEAIAYAVDNGARVINVSWVVPDVRAKDVLSRALDRAKDAGVLVVASAGNDGTNLDETPVYPAGLDADNLITVGATDARDLPAEFSNHGKRSVDISAPGVHIVSTLPGGGYGTYSGTSMAAPFVSATAALLWSAERSADWKDVRNAILETGDDIAALHGLTRTGARLDAGAAAYSKKFAPAVIYMFSGFDGVEPDVAHSVAVRADVTDSDVFPADVAARYRLTLLVPGDSGPNAAVGVEIGDGNGSTAVTDETGRAFVGADFDRTKRAALLRGTDVTQLSLTLPKGTYALVMELVDVTTPSSPVTLGDPSAVFFGVGLADETPMPDGGDLPGVGSSPSQGGGEVGTTSPSMVEQVPADTSVAQGTDGPNGTVADLLAPSTTIVGRTSDSVGSDGSRPAPTGTPAPDSPSTASTASGDGSSVPPTDQPSGGGTPTDDAPNGAGGVGGSETPGEVVAVPSPTVESRDTSFSLVRVNPDRGPSAGGTAVTIVGELPHHAAVTIGEVPAEIIAEGDGYVVVVTGLHDPGVVDVVVADRGSGATASLAGAYTYEAPEPVGAGEARVGDSGTPETKPATGSGVSDVAPVNGDVSAGDLVPPNEPIDSTDSSQGTSGVDSPSGGSAVVGGSPDASGEVPAADPDAPESGNVATPAGHGVEDWVSDRLVTPDGLNLVPLHASDRLAGLDFEKAVSSMCGSPECPGWVLPIDRGTGGALDGHGRGNSPTADHEDDGRATPDSKRDDAKKDSQGNSKGKND
jgi:subtilisin family serine protease